MSNYVLAAEYSDDNSTKVELTQLGIHILLSHAELGYHYTNDAAYLECINELEEKLRAKSP